MHFVWIFALLTKKRLCCKASLKLSIALLLIALCHFKLCLIYCRHNKEIETRSKINFLLFIKKIQEIYFTDWPFWSNILRKANRSFNMMMRRLFFSVFGFACFFGETVCLDHSLAETERIRWEYFSIISSSADASRTVYTKVEKRFWEAKTNV